MQITVNEGVQGVGANGSSFAYEAGQVVDASDDVAERLVNAGHAVIYVEPEPELDAVVDELAEEPASGEDSPAPEAREAAPAAEVTDVTPAAEPAEPTAPASIETEEQPMQSASVIVEQAPEAPEAAPAS